VTTTSEADWMLDCNLESDFRFGEVGSVVPFLTPGPGPGPGSIPSASSFHSTDGRDRQRLARKSPARVALQFRCVSMCRGKFERRNYRR
jgi:hypothetical protein